MGTVPQYLLRTLVKVRTNTASCENSVIASYRTGAFLEPQRKTTFYFGCMPHVCQMRFIYDTFDELYHVFFVLVCIFPGSILFSSILSNCMTNDQPDTSIALLFT